MVPKAIFLLIVILDLDGVDIGVLIIILVTDLVQVVTEVTIVVKMVNQLDLLTCRTTSGKLVVRN